VRRQRSELLSSIVASVEFFEMMMEVHSTEQLDMLNV
jgi:hypothetical protein